MKNINDWVLKYNYFDFTDKEGIRDISHELLHDIIEKCIELEERIEKLESVSSDSFKGEKTSLEPLTIEELTEGKTLVDCSKLKKDTKRISGVNEETKDWIAVRQPMHKSSVKRSNKKEK